jgi:2-oxoglutarate dehydrogenase E2 component (dihydrolipoamide succinyltransferase)
MGPVARASALALREIPAINASIENDDTITYRDNINLSIVVATPKGLVTPVLRNMKSRSIVGIEQGIAELGKKVTRMDFPLACSLLWNILANIPLL